MRKIELSPLDQQVLENQLRRSIRACHEAIARCNHAGDYKGINYIREVKLKPLTNRLRDVRRGYIWE